MIVVSDMMGTLTTGSPFLGLVDWVKHNQSKVRLRMGGGTEPVEETPRRCNGAADQSS